MLKQAKELDYFLFMGEIIADSLLGDLAVKIFSCLSQKELREWECPLCSWIQLELGVPKAIFVTHLI